MVKQYTIPQEEETQLQAVQTASFTWRYAYSRAAESRAVGARGQDRLVLRCSDAAFVFALCDGVGQSFYGDLGARFLAEALVEWLWKALPVSVDCHTLGSDLSVQLRVLTDRATAEVVGQPLPQDSPRMVVEVLERKRAAGSETTFACGRVDRPSPAFPDGRLVLTWMGDSRLRIWGPTGERTAELGDTFHTSERWSTLRGPLESDPHVFVTTLMRQGIPVLTSVMAYSDGLASLDRSASSPSAEALQSLIDLALDSATSDDISFLEIISFRMDSLPVPPQGPEWHHEVISAPTASATARSEAPRQPQLPAPASLEVKRSGSRLHASWQPVKGARSYQLEVTRNAVWTWVVPEIIGTSWDSSRLEKGKYRLRVRALQDGHSGTWSAGSESELRTGVSFRLMVALLLAIGVLAVLFASRQLIIDGYTPRNMPRLPIGMPTVKQAEPIGGQPAELSTEQVAVTPDPTLARTTTPAASPTRTPPPLDSRSPAVSASAVQPSTRPGYITDFENWGKWVPGDQKYGTFSQSAEQVHTGNFAGKFTYGLPATQDNFQLFKPSTPIRIDSQATALQIWVYGDGSNNWLNAWISTASGQIWQRTFGRINHTGWLQMTARLGDDAPWPNAVVFGNKDATKMAYPVSFYALVLDADDGKAATGTVFVDDLTVLTGNPPPAASNPPPPPSTSTAQISVRADSTQVTPGTCTTLRWDIQGVRYVYLNDVGQGGQASQQVCPIRTTTYTWRIGLLDGTEVARQVTVNLVPGTARDVYFLARLRDKVPDRCARDVCNVFIDKIEEYLLPKPAKCDGKPYSDPVKVTWMKGQPNVLSSIAPYQLVEVYGQCWLDLGQYPSVGLLGLDYPFGTAPYFIRLR